MHQITSKHFICCVLFLTEVDGLFETCMAGFLFVCLIDCFFVFVFVFFTVTVLFFVLFCCCFVFFGFFAEV